MSITPRERVLSRFADPADSAPLFAPDLRIWFDWHQARNTLPPGHSASIDEIHRKLGTPVWRVERPWSVRTPHKTEESDLTDERRVTIDVAGQDLVSRWTRGPDGDWWQTEYPVKSVDDLKAVLEYVKSREFLAHPEIIQKAEAEVGEDGVVLVDLPARPFSWLMLEMLGWSEGLMLLFDAPDLIDEIVTTADQSLQLLTKDLLECPARLFYSPDNLDAQFVSPGYFGQYLKESYARTAQTLRGAGKHLVVHAGGPVGPLLEGIAGAGIDGVTGVCGPPQGDSPLDEARTVSGDALVLIGGIPQDHLLAGADTTSLDSCIDEILDLSHKDPRIIAAVADHVPTSAEFSRLERICATMQT